jgi:hypothetical protein
MACPHHRSRRMSGWITSQRAWLSVERLSGYAPDLNSIEKRLGDLKSQEPRQSLVQHD